MLAFFGRVCYHTVAVGKDKQNPGLAKFGIALEWGSRGLEFESRHSDQVTGMNTSSFLFLFFVRPLTRGLLYYNHGRRQLAHSAQLPRVRISTLGPKSRNEHQLISAFFVRKSTALSSNFSAVPSPLWSHGCDASIRSICLDQMISQREIEAILSQ